MNDATGTLEERFLELAAKHARRFRRIAQVYATKVETDDLLQEIWLQIWLCLPGFAGKARADTWAFRVALNTAISHRRRARPTTEALDDHASTRPAASIDSLDGVLKDFLNSLKPVDRAALVLSLNNCDHDEISAVLGLSANAVAIRLTRMRKQYESRYI